MHQCYQTRGPWALRLCLRTNVAIGKSSRCCTYTLFLPLWGSTLSLISLYMDSGFPRYRPIFKIAIYGHATWPSGRYSNLPYMGMQLGHWQKFQKWHIYLFPEGGRGQIELIFALQVVVSEIRPNLQNCQGMKLGHWPKLQKLHLYPHSTSKRSNCLSQIFKIAIFGHETWSVQKI